MKMSTITLNRTLQQLLCQKTGGTKYYGFPEIFGPGGPNISGDLIFRYRPHCMDMEK